MNINSTFIPGPQTGGNVFGNQKPASSDSTFLAMLGCAGDGSAKQAMMEQAKDPNSNFWSNVQVGILDAAEKNEEARKEQEKMELLGLMVDLATGRYEETSGVSAVTGLKLGLNADQEIFVKGGVPSELELYLRTLGGRMTFEVAEDPEEDQDSRVNKVDGAETEQLHAGNDRSLSAEDLQVLAEKYDPNNMTSEEYSRFLDDLTELGAVSQDVIQRLKNHSLFDGVDLQSFFAYDGPQKNYTPVFQHSPVDNNIEGWLQNRLLWKPGITRESAKRGGFVSQYDHIIEEEKTLSRINEILAGVKQQRSTAVFL